MLLISYSGIDVDDLIKTYSDRIIKMNFEITDGIDNIVNYIEQIKICLNKYDIVIIPYKKEIVVCLDTLNINYILLYPAEINKALIKDLDEYEIFKGMAIKTDSIVVNESLYDSLNARFNWIKNIALVEDKGNNVTETTDIVTETTDNATETLVTKSDDMPIDKKQLTLKELIEKDIDITESDVRDLKSLTNKFKVAMLLQAKSRLSIVLKLCGVLDKLYEELVNRVDLSLKTTDTASLMYTADYISKALGETNQFIMSLITNEKIQNFFIIDNSNIINISDNRIDIDRREKIRKAAEIVIDNADYFTTGQYDKIVNPNQEDEIQN